MAPPPASMSSRMAALLLRVLAFAFLLASLVISTTNTVTLVIGSNDVQVRFKDVYTYRYMVAANAFGMAYTFWQIVITLHNIVTGNCLMSGDGNLVFDFYADKVVSYVLATGAAAAIGATKDMKPVFEALLLQAEADVTDADKFFNKGYASASLLLLGFVCTAILSVFSSYALPKKA